MKSKLLLSCLLACLVLAAPSSSQTAIPETQASGDGNADAYYHYALGHLYAELAASYGSRSEFLNKAIDNYRAALEANPSADFLAEELSDLYFDAGRLREAVQDAESALARDPKDVNARRILGRIYFRLLGDPQQVNEEMVKRAIEQYVALSELRPNDLEVWLTLGRLQRHAQNSLGAEAAFQKVLEAEPDNETALLELARLYSDLGDQPRTADILRRIVANNPDPRTLGALARSYEQQEEFGLAVEAYRQALAMAPDNVLLKRSLAQNLALTGQPGEAIKLYEELVKEDPNDSDSYLRISQIHGQQREYKEALAALESAKKGAADNLEVLYHEVNLLEAMDRPEEAIERMKAILESTRKESYSGGERRNRAVFLERLALMYRSNGRIDEAVAAFEELGSLDPELRARVAAQIGDTYRQGKQFQKAAEVLNKASEEFPDDRMVTIVHATVLADIGESNKAVASIEKLTDGKKDLNSYQILAQIYEKTKRFDKMARVINRALDAATTDEERATFLFMRGAMFERQKRYRDAETAFREVLRLDAENSSAMNYLGYMFADQNMQLEEAVALITKALEHEPGNGAYLDSLGWAFYRLDRLEEAEDNLRQAVEKVNDDPVVHDHLGDVYARQGKLEEAITHWRISLREWESSSVTERDPAQVSAIEKKLEGAEIRLARETSVGSSESTQP